MTDTEEDLATMFHALLSCLEERLSLDQMRELDTCVESDELNVAFELLCAALRERARPLPTEARLLLKHVAYSLGVNKIHWQDLARDRPDWGAS